ncbi:MAG: peptide chain release factor 1 [Spirochaetes bacterium]|nr:peptide chain release factor 1 [Spirochaetota bacterium]MBN2769098.1 peptide chain release factor 1 [Spirochaetota bacterium]
MLEKLKALESRFKKIEQEMSDPDIIKDQTRFRDLNREHSRLSPVIESFAEYKKAVSELADTKKMLEDERDSDMREMLAAEKRDLEEKIPRMEQNLTIMLLPKDPHSGKNVIIEIRAGTGGEEAALFVSDLYRMYTRYADLKKWKIEIMDQNQTEIGGLKEVTFLVSGADVYDELKYESGAHRVQRVPETESGGRIHTSAVTVAVMPEAEDTDVEIRQEDLRVDVYRASGHGGQSVNTTDSAVRITHVPTGLIVTCQDEKSQLKNKQKAMKVLRARLFELEEQRRQSEQSQMRKSQVGSGDRSERIRTYNFPQSRLTDHRIGLTLYSLESVLEGELEPVIVPLKEYEIEQLLKSNDTV